VLSANPPRANLATVVFGAAALQSASAAAEFAGAGLAESPATSGDSRRSSPSRAPARRRWLEGVSALSIINASIK